jgi:hypothetical protein
VRILWVLEINKSKNLTHWVPRAAAASGLGEFGMSLMQVVIELMRLSLSLSIGIGSRSLLIFRDAFSHNKNSKLTRC